MRKTFLYCGVSLKVLFKDGKVREVKITSRSKDAREVTYDDLLLLKPDYSKLSSFDKRVLEKVREIPYGMVATYNEIAKVIGKGKAIRAVGNALARNPFPVIIPCHRVIKADLRLGGFSLGKNLKIKLLEEEGVKIEKGRVRNKVFRF